MQLAITDVWQTFSSVCYKIRYATEKHNNCSKHLGQKINFFFAFNERNKLYIYYTRTLPKTQ